MEKDFKMLWISHNTIYLKNSKGETFTISTSDLREILNNAALKATKQIKNYKLEAN